MNRLPRTRTKSLAKDVIVTEIEIVTEIVTETETATAIVTEQETATGTGTGTAGGAEAVSGTDGVEGTAGAGVEAETEIVGGEIGVEEGGQGIETETGTAGAGVEAEIATGAGVGTGAASHAGPTLLARKQHKTPLPTSRPWRRRARRLTSR